MDFFKLFRTKAARHKVTDFIQTTVKIELYRVQRARRTFSYEVDVMERKKYEFVRVGTLKLEDVDRIGQLLRQSVAYVNGIK